MYIQLWSQYYAPETMGIAPLSTVVARNLLERGHRVEVVAAHPHYPVPRWGRSFKPYRENLDGVPILRLPIWPGRDSAAQRIRQELSLVAPLAASVPLLPRPDVLLAVSPSFPSVTPAMAFSRLRRVPWVMWLQDILPDGATATGVLEEGRMINAARRLERAAYRSASRIVVIADSFRDNLLGKGVPDHKIVRVYNPASLPIRDAPRPSEGIDDRLALNMGNIGHSQNLAEVARAFEDDPKLAELGARFVMAGDGVRGGEVAEAIRTDRVEVTGMLDSEPLERLLSSAAVGIVSQTYDGTEFNVPSKLMNFMGQAVPLIASVPADSEVARIVEQSGVGWVAASTRECASRIAQALCDPDGRERRSRAGLEFAREHFSPESVTASIDAVLTEAVASDRSSSVEYK